MKKNTKILLVFLVVLLIGILFFSVFREEKNKKENEEKINIIFPEGVEIMDENKINVQNDYIFEINNENLKKVNYKNNILSVYEENEFLPSYSFTVKDNLSNLNLLDWLNKYNQENNLLFFEQKELKNIEGQNVYKIQIEGDPEHYNYFIDGKNYKIYIFSTASPSDFEDILNTFKIIKK